MIFLMTPSLRAPPFPMVVVVAFSTEEEVRRIVSRVQDKRGGVERRLFGVVLM